MLSVRAQKDMKWQTQVPTRSWWVSYTKTGISVFIWGLWDTIVLIKQRRQNETCYKASCSSTVENEVKK